VNAPARKEDGEVMAIRLSAIIGLLVNVFVFAPEQFNMAAEPADPVPLLAPFVNDDTFAAGYLNLAALAKDEAGNVAHLFTILPRLSEDGPSAALSRIEEFVGRLRAAGAESAYLVAGLSDANVRGGPLVILHLRPGSQPEDIIRIFAPKAPMQIGDWGGEIEVRPHDGDSVLIGTPSTLKRYASLAKSERPDLLVPLRKLENEGAMLAAVFCPGADFRRVVRELWPSLPGSLAPLRGELADRWQHLELAVNMPPKANPRLVLQASDPQAAETFANLLRDLPAAASDFEQLGEQRQQVKRYATALLDAVPPRVEGTRAIMEFPTRGSELAAMRSLATRATDAALESTRRNQRLNQFKELAIAMFNYYDKNKCLPAAAIRAPDGRALLSWRVAVLEYMDSDARSLYKQFHLDEPWDSPHNRTLIEKMPAVFADPDPKLKQLSREGKTMYQVPSGADTIFHGDSGSTFQEILDGTSKTILLVEVEPLRAVVWTKPEDWEVDMRNPRRGVERDDRTYFIAAFADAHTSLLPVEISADDLRALLTRAGREVVERPY
jgi:hypothetical protein